MGHRLLKHVLVVFINCQLHVLTCFYGEKHMPNRSLYITMWSYKLPKTLKSVQKLANVVRNWKLAMADCYFEHCYLAIVHARHQ